MPTQLEELVEFLHHGNSQIRQVASTSLIGYSTSDPSIFMTGNLTPIKDLKMLIKDYTPIAKNALIMLVNVSGDGKILKNLVEDDQFIESLLTRVTNPKEENANEACMLLANLAKSKDMMKIMKLERAIPKSDLSKSKFAIDQLMDCFVKGSSGKYNKHADFDYLAYFFGDLSQYDDCQEYLTDKLTRYDGIIPLSKMKSFTEHKSDIRRRGVAATIKNVSMEVDFHERIMNDKWGANMLPSILLPIAGSETLSAEDIEGMPEELKMLPPDKEREKDMDILKTHLETLLLFTTSRQGRDRMRTAKVYPLIRETHLHVENPEVQELCDRIVQMIMGIEEDEEDNVLPAGVPPLGGDRARVRELPDEDDDEDKVVDIL